MTKQKGIAVLIPVFMIVMLLLSTLLLAACDDKKDKKAVISQQVIDYDITEGQETTFNVKIRVTNISNAPVDVFRINYSMEVDTEPRDTYLELVRTEDMVWTIGVGEHEDITISFKIDTTTNWKLLFASKEWEVEYNRDEIFGDHFTADPSSLIKQA